MASSLGSGLGFGFYATTQPESVMSSLPEPRELAPSSARPSPINMALEIAVIPVSDVDRAKQFYSALGWRLDLDFKGDEDYRVIQFTPPGSGCSVILGSNVTAAAPGSAQGLHLIVADLASVRAELVCRGIDVSEPFHDGGGVFHHSNAKGIVRGLNPQRQSYASYASFRDPDGNTWLLQEVTARLAPGLKVGDPRFTSQVLKALFG
jgi:catechol 2,3-dioxygenase-like lactoylglutathione lyase family enzyme